jgi:DNA-binding transcriptional ArsR family regulator
MRDVVTIAKALSDENRVRIVAMLDGRELCVCQVIELLELAPSTVSKHLAILKQARLVEGRKDGRWMYYRLADEEASEVARAALRWVLQMIRGDKRLHEDARHLRQILALHPEVLCSQRRERATPEGSPGSALASFAPLKAR